MKAIAVLQPWAWAIMRAGKDIENRSWRTNHRGPLLVHAGKSDKLLGREMERFFRDTYNLALPTSFTFGALVGVVDVVDVVPVAREGEPSKWAMAGGFGWVLANPRAFAEPVPFRGAQMLFEVPDELVPAS